MKYIIYIDAYVQKLCEVIHITNELEKGTFVGLFISNFMVLLGVELKYYR